MDPPASLRFWVVPSAERQFYFFFSRSGSVRGAVDWMAIRASGLGVLLTCWCYTCMPVCSGTLIAALAFTTPKLHFSLSFSCRNPYLTRAFSPALRTLWVSNTGNVASRPDLVFTPFFQWSNPCIVDAQNTQLTRTNVRSKPQPTWHVVP